MIEAVAELFLLSQTKAFIATYGSTFSETAYLMSKHPPLYQLIGDCTACSKSARLHTSIETAQ